MKFLFPIFVFAVNVYLKSKGSTKHIFFTAYKMSKNKKFENILEIDNNANIVSFYSTFLL